jgi:hypothetical protein
MSTNEGQTRERGPAQASTQLSGRKQVRTSTNKWGRARTKARAGGGVQTSAGGTNVRRGGGCTNEHEASAGYERIRGCINEHQGRCERARAGTRRGGSGGYTPFIPLPPPLPPFLSFSLSFIHFHIFLCTCNIIFGIF